MSDVNVVLDIDTEGNIHGLYTEEVDLFAIGRIVDVRKASNVEFCQEVQRWQVTSLDGEILHENISREKAIEFEIKEFSPGGKYYDSN